MSYVSIGLNILITLIYTPWMIHQLGKSDYGVFALVSSFISYFLLDFGIGSAISRFVSKYKESEDQESLKKLYGVIATVYLTIDIILVSALFVLYFFITDIFVKLTPEELNTFKDVYVIAAFFSICTFTLKPLDGVMTAHEFFVPLKALDMVQRIGTVLLVALALILGGRVYALIFINGLVALTVALTKMHYLHKNGSLSINLKKFDWLMAKSIFGFSLWIFLINLAQRFRVNLVPAILGAKSGTEEISVFSLGMALEGFVWTFAYALNGLFIPRVTRMVQSGTDRKEITLLMTKVGRFQLFVVGLIVIGFIGLGKPFISMWIGEGFIDTYFIAICLIAPNIITMTQQIGTTLSYVENEVKYNASISFSAAILSFALCLLAADRYGAVGCAVAVFISLTLSAVAMNIFYKKKLGIDIWYFFKHCHFKIMPVLIAMLCILWYISNTFDIAHFIPFGLTALVFVIAYILICYRFLFNSEEKETAHNIMKHIGIKTH